MLDFLSPDVRFPHWLCIALGLAFGVPGTAGVLRISASTAPL
jgi:hypothetical protein